MNRRGQAMTEMVFIIPLMFGLAVGVASVIYMCSQGVKVQQAANLEARIQGQESVAGGVSLSSIQHDNGVDATRGDVDPTNDTIPLDAARVAVLEGSQKPLQSATSVYGKLQRAVRSFFGPGEQQGVFVPLPQYGLVGYSDQVKVVRIIQPPQLFGFSLDPISLQATAYGGEDSHMYGLVRWGTTGPNSQSGSEKFWTDPSNLNGND